MIDAVYAQGDDALQNQFEISVGDISFLSGLGKLKFRVTEVEVPEISITTYDVHYKSQKFTKPAAKINTENSWGFTLRVDKNYAWYEAFKAWLNFVVDGATGMYAEDVNALGQSAIRADFDIVPIDANDVQLGPGWKAVKSYPISIAAVSFNHETSAPILVRVTMHALKIV